MPIAQADSPLKAAAAASEDESVNIPLGPVIRCVVIATMGAFAFGYHLGVVNGPLGAIAADLGFAENAGLQGAVRPRAPVSRQCHAFSITCTSIECSPPQVLNQVMPSGNWELVHSNLQPRDTSLASKHALETRAQAGECSQSLC